jgi:glycosyltransferase involved in cell wall biosynthesis
MKREPQLSILIPTYNFGRFLGEAVESVLSQDFGDYELTVIDNASTDETREVMQRFNDPRIEYIVNPRNMGPFHTYAFFHQMARGKYLRFLCADDVLIPGVLQEQVNALNRYKTLGLVTCDMIVTDDRLENRQLYKFYPGFENGQAITAYALQIVMNAIGGPSSFMYPRELARGVNYDPAFGYVGDLKFGMDLLKGRDYFNIDRPGYYYRRHEATWTAVETNLASQSAEWLRLIKEYGQICHLSALRLLRMSPGAGQKLELLKWLATHLLDRKSIQSSFKARKKLWINLNH